MKHTPSKIRRILAGARRIAVALFAIFTIAGAIFAWLMRDEAHALALIGIRHGSAQFHALDHRYLPMPVRHVKIRSGRYADEIAIVEALALAKNASMLDSYRHAELRINRLPGIIDVRVRRRPPATLVVAVRDASPAAWLAGPGKRRLIASNGDVLSDRIAPRAPAGLPEIIPGKDDSTAIASAYSKPMTMLERLAEGGIFWASRVRTIHPVPGGDYMVLLSDSAFPPLLLNESVDPGTANLASAVLADFRTRTSRKKVEMLDLRSRGEVVVRFRKILESTDSVAAPPSGSTDTVPASHRDTLH